MAEASASTVGRWATWLWEVGPEGGKGTPHAMREIVQLTRKAWDNGGEPSVPEGITEKIEQLFLPSTAQKSNLEP